MSAVPPTVVLQTLTSRVSSNCFSLRLVRPGGTIANSSLQKQYTPMFGLPNTSANITVILRSRRSARRPTYRLGRLRWVNYDFTFLVLDCTDGNLSRRFVDATPPKSLVDLVTD